MSSANPIIIYDSDSEPSDVEMSVGLEHMEEIEEELEEELEEEPEVDEEQEEDDYEEEVEPEEETEDDAEIEPDHTPDTLPRPVTPIPSPPRHVRTTARISVAPCPIPAVTISPTPSLPATTRTSPCYDNPFLKSSRYDHDTHRKYFRYNPYAASTSKSTPPPPTDDIDWRKIVEDLLAMNDKLVDLVKDLLKRQSPPE